MSQPSLFDDDDRQRDYYNTNDERGPELIDSRAQAKLQQNLILGFFRAHPGRRFAPHEVHSMMPPGTPLTSTRRAITNLTDAGQLEKTDQRVMGTFGKRVFTWQLLRR
jgi:hypothetical protein